VPNQPVLRRIEMFQRVVFSCVFPAKAGTHFRHGHRPSPVWQIFGGSIGPLSTNEVYDGSEC
jgi:hypothetical protein